MADPSASPSAVDLATPVREFGFSLLERFAVTRLTVRQVRS